MTQRSSRCTAVVNPGETPPNILFIPPCDCPDCVPVDHYDPRARDDGWLRVRGDSRRYRVEALTLGERGRSVLG